MFTAENSEKRTFFLHPQEDAITENDATLAAELQKFASIPDSDMEDHNSTLNQWQPIANLMAAESDPYFIDVEDSPEPTSSAEDADMCPSQNAFTGLTDTEGEVEDDDAVLTDEYELVELSPSERAEIENNHESYWKVERDIEIKAYRC